MLVIPKHIQIETINGACTAKCTMCSINTWTRKPNVMTIDDFQVILNKLSKYKSNFQYLTLHGCGEPLLDKNLYMKVKLAKDMGFEGVGFATNCTNLDENTSIKLINAGLDTIICSVDSLRKDIHENIRVGTNFEKVVQNIKKFIELRNSMHSKTKVMMRFIRQKDNYSEWEQYEKYWNSRLDHSLGDQVLKFDVHNWGDKLINYDKSSLGISTTDIITCEDLVNRLLIYSSGDVGLCCSDDNGYFNMGNVLSEDPITIYNNEIFTKMRNDMYEGKLFDSPPCNNCTIPLSRHFKNGE